MSRIGSLQLRPRDSAGCMEVARRSTGGCESEVRPRIQRNPAGRESGSALASNLYWCHRMKKTRCSVAALIRRDERYLAVRRPPDDDRLPDVWGLPAVTLTPGELPEEGLRRVGREKLGVELEPTRLIGVSTADRGDYQLVLMDIEARLISGEPDCRNASTRNTRYVEQLWAVSIDLLREGAARGSLCCRIVLDSELVQGSGP
jgi:ADP-ribose pyrophosphatase YjhB (NUDIX family)